MAWWNGDLGAGGRRPEPTIAALLVGASWFVFGYTENSVEPLLLNALGGGVQVLALFVFLRLTDNDMLQTMLVFSVLSCLYFAVVCIVGFGTAHNNVELYQWLCSVAGLLNAAATLLTFLFLNRTVQMLPHWGVSSLTMANGLLWLWRGYLLSNPYMAVRILLLYTSLIAPACAI
jgi:hypothetical protein